MEAELFRQIWPIFSAEAREHLAAISTGVMELEAEPSRVQLLDPVRRTAHSLKGSAASLGLVDVETLAHAIEGSLAGYNPAAGLGREAVQVILDAVEAIEEALASADAGGQPGIASLDALLAALGARAAPRRRASDPAAAHHGAAPAPPPPLAPAAAAAVQPLAHLEATLQALCAPVTDEERTALVVEAAAAAGALAAAVPLHARAQAERVVAGFPRLAVGGAEAARAAAALAGDLVDLRLRLEQPPPGGPAAGPAAPAAEAVRPADKSIRVLSSTLDSLARQLELLALSEARHARRAREVAAAEVAAREVVRQLELALQALRLAEAGGERGPVEGAVLRLRALGAELRRLAQDGQREAETQRLAGTVLREDLRALRMVPAALMLEPLRRAVREVAGRLGKTVELEVSGGDVKLDRRVVDELRDPLLHLVRNAADHGVEDAEGRRAAGKPEVGRVAVRVEPRGSRVGVVVEDDGRGLDLERVRAAAVRQGLLTAEAAARLPDADAARLVFLPGFSTARAVTEISGRGVGLDVVQSTVVRLGGAVDVSSVPGRSTRFDLELPLTMAATAAILFRVGRDLGALSADAVERVLLLAPGDVGTVAGRATVEVGSGQVPFAWLSQLLGLAPGRMAQKAQPALVLALGAQRAVVAVDEVLGQQEVVVGSLGDRAARASHLAGASVLDDGRVVGVLNAAEVMRRVQPASLRAQAPRAARVVVADDSLTTRSAMKAVLELAGYQVAPAGDGEEAFQLVRDQGAALVVSDVQMPRLDGLGLAARLKADPRLRSIPVILVTSLDSPEDRAAGLAAGADGYLVKREVQRGKLLELVRQLLPGGRVIRVLVADDSRTFRAVLRAILEKAPEIEVVGEAADGGEAVSLTALLRPDVVSLDLRMPGKDGLAAIEEIMARLPTPVVVVSGEVGPEHQQTSFRALALGAVEVLAKPSSADPARFEREAEAIRMAVRAVAGLKLVTRHGRGRSSPPAPAPTPRPAAAPALTPSRPFGVQPAAPAAARPPPGPARAAITSPGLLPAVPPRVATRVVGVAASTGGPPALARLLGALPAGYPGAILVVQHIATGFERGLVQWLGRETRLPVKLAEHGEPLRGGTVYVAPEGRHLTALVGTAFLDDGPAVRGFRPSGTALFHSLAREFGPSATGVILTGMGDDGAEGLKAVRARGGLTIAQGPASSVVFGMPRVAIECGAAEETLELDEIAAALLRPARGPRAAS